jgi:hypothetical protein
LAASIVTGDTIRVPRSRPDRHHGVQPRTTDRILDAIALFVLLGGLATFFLARSALTSVGEGTYTIPQGVSAVAQTDLLVAQSRLGLVIVVVGVLLGVAAAVRHKLR